MDLNKSHQNIYINTLSPKSDRMSENSKKSKRKRKITVIKNKYNKDGSITKIRQDIYKNYGNIFAKRESQRLNSSLNFYHGTEQQFENEIVQFEQKAIKR